MRAAYAPSGRWEWTFEAAAEIVDGDEAVWAHIRRMMHRQIIVEAAADGFELFGSPTIDAYPTVWLPNWFEDGSGAFVAPSFAIPYGIDLTPTMYRCIATCGARKVLEGDPVIIPEVEGTVTIRTE